MKSFSIIIAPPDSREFCQLLTIVWTGPGVIHLSSPDPDALQSELDLRHSVGREVTQITETRVQPPQPRVFLSTGDQVEQSSGLIFRKVVSSIPPILPPNPARVWRSPGASDGDRLQS